MANFFTALLFGILSVSVVAERPASARSPEGEAIAPELKPISLLAGKLNVTHNEATKVTPTCGNDVTAADHNTLGSCKIFHCDIKKRGYGVVCDNIPGMFNPSNCVCARGWCAVDVNPEKTGSSSVGRCEPCDGVVKAGFEEVMKLGATDEERSKGKAKRVTKAVGKCANFHCSASRTPDSPEGGGVGCNAADATCYCLQPDYFAYDPNFDRTKGLTSSADWKNADAKCVHIDKIPDLK